MFSYIKVPLEQAIHTCHPFVKTKSGKMLQIYEDLELPS